MSSLGSDRYTCYYSITEHTYTLGSLIIRAFTFALTISVCVYVRAFVYFSVFHILFSITSIYTFPSGRNL
ncbi:hypothetical protein EDB83DRAFT_2415242 [Lactarius deliciosus]|nr:hypothetical protein EDB83DRAFT_2415242 [Lactarius deliciosus]